MRVMPDEIQARAGLVASEFSLSGLGAATLVVTSLAVVLHGQLALSLVRPTTAAGAGLLSCGVLVSILGRYLDLGGSARRPAPLPRTWRPALMLGAALAVLGWLALSLVAGHDDARATGVPLSGLALLLAASGLLGVPLLAILGLRSLAAVEGGAPMPVAQLFQAVSHSLLGGLGLVLLVGLIAGSVSVELEAYLGAAIATLCAHTILWSSWLLRGSRRRLGRLRQDGVRVPALERGHWLASAAVVLGLLAPGLVVLANLVSGLDTGLLVACSVLAVSNHAMRYAWVLLGFERVG